MTIPVLDLAAIEAAAKPQVVLDTVRAALVAHAEGRTTVPPPLHLDFPEAGGDCHVKAGLITGADRLHGQDRRPASTGTPNRAFRPTTAWCACSARVPARCAPSSTTGDGSTAWRTAAAGALITHAMSHPGAATVAVFGTGEQARLQVTWLAMLRPVTRVLVCGRTGHKTPALCAWLADRGLPARPASAREAAGAPIVITTTPATAPVPRRRRGQRRSARHRDRRGHAAQERAPPRSSAVPR